MQMQVPSSQFHAKPAKNISCGARAVAANGTGRYFCPRRGGAAAALPEFVHWRGWPPVLVPSPPMDDGGRRPIE